MDTQFGFSDIAELRLTRLSGERPTGAVLAASETTFTINAQYEADGLGARIGVDAAVHAPGNAEAWQYRGRVEYRINFYGPAASEDNAELIALLWPYLRAGLLEQAARLGETSIIVPLDCPQLPPPSTPGA